MELIFSLGGLKYQIPRECSLNSVIGNRSSVIEKPKIIFQAFSIDFFKKISSSDFSENNTSTPIILALSFLRRSMTVA
jgi:hypothetical protein